ncbi:MAG TPA: bifunctional aspartate kinase/diaminopimelate decarboxylase [Rhodanobacteraceae bacterium]|nr:bifunctional aspartate kinase/diaminopimelate decarboxylase [Rhodanobacteraceae bacterium]
MNAYVAAPLSPTSPWVVLKFGGTSVATAERWRTILELASARRAAGARVVVVVSALAGVTDALKALCGCPRGERAAAVDKLVERHRALVAEMDLAGVERAEGWLASLRALATGADPDGEQAPDVSETGPTQYLWQAAIQAHGELLSSSLGAAFMTANGLATEWLDAREALLAREVPFLNERSRALSAQVQIEADPAFALALAARGSVFITQGFIARDGGGHTVLLGRGGSDTSAAYFGALLRAERVETWTDVAGMFTADPRQVPNARLLQRLDYDEAQEIASTGAKVLHARCISPCRRARVPLWIKDTKRPEFQGTVIAPMPPETAPSIKAVSSRRGITLVSMETAGMWQEVGFLADVFALFKQNGLSVDLIGSAETNVTVSLDPTENLLDSDVVAALATDLSKVCRVKVIAPCAAVTLVGRGMRSMLHRLSGVLAEFGRERVHLISQSSNNLNLTFVVDEGMLDGLLPRLHELLIRAGAMRTDDTALFGPSWQALYGEQARPVVQPWWRTERTRLLDLARRPAGDGGVGGTPGYVYHLPTLRARARALMALKAIDHVYYAIKANAHPAVLRTLAEEGIGFECVSPGELAAVDAIDAARGSRRLFTPNFAPREDYAHAVERGVTLTLDGLHPLRHWSELFAGHDINLRIDLGRGLGHHDKVRTGGATSKFGLPLEQLDEFVSLAREHAVRIVGLHAHLGSGILDANYWPWVYAQLASIAERIGSVTRLDLGGGLGVPAHPGEAPLDLAAVDAALMEVKQTYPQYELWLEPGRWLVAEAGVLLARVTQTKSKGAVNYLGCDAGMHALIRPALYDAWHPIVNLSRLDETATTLYQVVGPICESGDVLGSDRRLPEATEGDVLLIGVAGAYGESMASHYNLRPLAESVAIE